MNPPLAASEPNEFPSEATVPETLLQFELRTLLYQLLIDHLGPGVSVHANLFVYFDVSPLQAA